MPLSLVYSRSVEETYHSALACLYWHLQVMHVRPGKVQKHGFPVRWGGSIFGFRVDAMHCDRFEISGPNAA